MLCCCGSGFSREALHLARSKRSTASTLQVRHRCAATRAFALTRESLSLAWPRERNQRERHPVDFDARHAPCEPSLVLGARPGIPAGRSTPFDMRFNACRKHDVSPLRVRARRPLVYGRTSLCVRRQSDILSASLRAFRVHRSPPLRGPNINRSALQARRSGAKPE